MPELEHQQKIELIQSIHAGGAYQQPNGNMDWSKVFTEHPEYKEQFGITSMQSFYAFASGVIRKAKGPKPVGDGAAWGEPAKTALINELASNSEYYHPKTDRFRWKKIYSEHPEYRETLGTTTEHGQGRLVYFIAQMKKRGALRAASSKNSSVGSLILAKHRRQEADLEHIEIAAAAEPRPPQREKKAVLFCPNCGCALHILHQAFDTVMKLQGS